MVYKIFLQNELQDETDSGCSVDQQPLTWSCIWSHRPPNPVLHLKFSDDGLLFASVGKHDRLVRIWYENKKGASLFLNESMYCGTA